MSAGSGTTPTTPPDADVKSVQDFYVPAFRVLLNGVRQSVERHILSVTYSDSLTNVDSVDLVVNNWDPGDTLPGQTMEATFLYSDSPTFNPWQQMEVQMGYYRAGQDNLQTMLVGEISTMSPNFPASGPSTMSVRALNLLHQFRTQQKTLQFKDLKDSEIAKQIVADVEKDLKKKMSKISLQVDPEEFKSNVVWERKHEYIEMQHQYPIVFLMQRAREIGYDLWLEDKVDSSGTRVVTFHYVLSMDAPRPEYKLEWGKSLISFQPTLQTAKQVNSVTVRGWNVQTKKPIVETVTRADLVKKNKKVVAPEDLAVTEAPLSQKIEVVVDRAFRNPQDARDHGEAILLQLASGLVEAKGKTIGLPDLRAGSKVSIVINAGSRFNGLYQVTSTTHTIGDGGYTTEFSARMEAKTKEPKKAMTK